MVAHISQVSGKEFDYVIVGGGTAGLTLAGRLSEDASVRILVLEAGDANLNDPVNSLPLQRMVQLNNPQYDWCYKTVKQAHSNGREYAWSRGKGLGGSSAINFMQWTKPAREHLDAFHQLGNEGWNWETFDKYCKKSERFTVPDHDLDVLTFDAAHHGMSGPIHVSFPPLITNLERPFSLALAAFGANHVQDGSSGVVTGSTASPATFDAETHCRSYSVTGYYLPNSERSNLVVLVSAHVTKVATNSNQDGTVTATGVHFNHEGLPHFVYAAREVCLSAGTVASPQLLELSGIGRHDVLEKVGIEVKLELPGVGENVQEHLWTGVVCEVKEPVVNDREVQTWDPLFFPEAAGEHVEKHPRGEGLLNLHTVSISFVPLDAICSDTRKLQATISDTILTNIRNEKYAQGLRKQYELQLKHLKDKVPTLEMMLGPGSVAPLSYTDIKKKHITLCFALNAPFSRGTIHVASADPTDHPAIDPHVFEHPYDLLTLVELLKFNRRLLQTEPFKSVMGVELSPGDDVQTDDEIADWLRGHVETVYHTVGSCSMLPLEDGGTVDSRLKVHGTTNIRVVDISIIPLHVSSHTQVMAYAIAEQAADIIKGVI